MGLVILWMMTSPILTFVHVPGTWFWQWSHSIPCCGFIVGLSWLLKTVIQRSHWVSPPNVSNLSTANQPKVSSLIMTHIKWNSILPHGRQWPIYPTLSIPWLLMAWWCKEPGHQQICWSDSSRIFQPQYQMGQVHQLIGPWEIWMIFFYSKYFQVNWRLKYFQVNFSNWWLRYFLWNLPSVDCHWTSLMISQHWFR